VLQRLNSACDSAHQHAPTWFHDGSAAGPAKTGYGNNWVIAVVVVGPGRKKRADSGHMARAAALAERIRSAREDADITQQQLASRAGVALSTLRKIETGGITEPGYFTILAIVSALGISLPELNPGP
jgi:DNA-binding XRE family transcriptional regulator